MLRVCEQKATYRPGYLDVEGDNQPSQREWLKFSGRAIYLTQREQEIIDLLMQNMKNREVAAALNLSVRTVEFYIQNLRLKFACNNKKELLQRYKQSLLSKNSMHYKFT